MRHPHRDVVVIGYGIVGALACWRAAAAGQTVTCLDPEPGTGATYAAAGMLAAVTEADFGEPDLLRLNLHSARRWPDFAAAIERTAGTGIGYHRCGVLTVGYERADHDQLQRLAQLQQHSGLAVTPVTTEEARAREPMLGPRGIGGYWVPADGQVDPRRLMQALKIITDDHGVRVVRRSAAQLMDDHDGRVVGVVDEIGDEHPVDRVVVAAGYASGPLLAAHPRFQVPVRPVKGELIRLDGGLPGWSPESRIIRGFVQQRPIYVVFRAADDRTGGQEVVIGATSQEWADDRQVTAGAVFALLRDARALLPGIDEFAIKETTTRARPATPDNLPILGRSGIPGLVIATGHYRNGILLAAATAEALDLIFAGRELPDVWKPADPRRFHDQPSDHDQLGKSEGAPWVTTSR
ncbi:glycine oxidase ThiO [Microlunatus endophyticus]|uniref:glycine oxidase n=1 Tax=Microlunatus endophyticus TaxID=1716077 RepID=A0A917S7K3_9ACTN|nr:glycine oxidase ThiO [Microlunatus endophyticus]GGL62572.1 glycine oxidase ThiO [Microlunatus endophyticus]